MGRVCGSCGRVLSAGESICRDCGARYNPAARRGKQGRQRASRAQTGGGGGEWFGRLIRMIVIVGVIGAALYGGWRAIQWFSEATTIRHPYPEDPRLTVEGFFHALAAEDDQGCYKLLTMSRKSATAIGQHSREQYAGHFARIRGYLLRTVGEGFDEQMSVAENGRTVVFADGLVELGMTLKTLEDDDGREHYAIRQLRDFPMDVAPAMGLEAHNRMLQRVSESVESMGGPDEDAWPADVVIAQRGETQSQRINRLIESYSRMRQLDTRHAIIENVGQSFQGDRDVARFLRRIADDDTEPAHLQRLAEQYLQQ